MISGKAGSMAKEKSPENYGENNMNLTLSHIKDIKKSQDFSVETITEIFIHLRMKSHVNTVIMSKRKIWKKLELN